MDYAAARQHMIDSQIKTNKVTDPSVIEALAALPREAFVADAQKKLAYIDRPVAIGAGRRMTEPMVLARLLQVAQLKGTETALVVGAGTGYSAAILSRLVKKVVALESAPELAERAKAILSQLGIGNVSVVAGDLAAGRPADGPYDFILVDGAAEIVPDALGAQLADRGRLAVVIKDQGVVGRGTILVKADGVISPRAIFDADTEVLPGFTRPQRFVF
jgi:protein-L-isoaspartate(D-aspartate) O-methyltransferase